MRYTGSTTMRLEGVNEMRSLLRELPTKILKKAMRSAVTASSTPMLRALAQNLARAHRESGLLADTATRRIKTRRDFVYAVMGVRRKVVGSYKGRKRVPTKYLHLWEGGTAPHRIFRHLRVKVLGKGNRVNWAASLRKANALADMGAKDVADKTIQHPGSPPHAGVRAAFEATVTVAAQKFAQKFEEVIYREAAKLARK